MANIRVNTEGCLSLVSYLMCFSFSMFLSHAVDSIRQRDTLRENQTLVSAGGVFELGFFTDQSTGNHFVGIWFKDDVNKKAVWVAIRENPILDSSGVLQIRDDGNLILTDRRQVPMIVNSGMLATSSNTTATLLDSGNLILRHEDETIWQSFDYPTDTYLPGMKLGRFGLSSDQPRSQILVSWVSPQNPTRGLFTLSANSSKLGVWRSTEVRMEIGSWDGKNFQFIFQNSSNNYNFSCVSNANESYLTFTTRDSNIFSWFVIASSGNLDEYSMLEGKISMVSHPLCQGSGNSSWCLSSMPSMCENGDAFSEINGSIPSTVTQSISMNFTDCGTTCRNNCSCTAFTSEIQDGQTRCHLYYGNRNDLLDIIEEGGGIIHIRGGHDGGRKRRVWIIIMGSLLGSIAVSLLCYLIWRNRKYKARENQKRSQVDRRWNPEVIQFQLGSNMRTPTEVRSARELEFNREKDHEKLPLFSFFSLETATDYFSDANKLGEGGYGPVYKGKLVEGQEIAVKRLSKRSGQGLEEFKNEVTLISKLQHRNLVRLLGCCIQGEEYILIYEYMPNKSLDSFIFDSTRRVLLDWSKRVNITEGIAQGLLYLHKYSRLRIIHRDLKTSNILLDADMNPKISDFGMARIFGENEIRAKTNRVVGTYGYMSPEYAMDGLFSEKSDVYSFGVIVLEIVSGKKNVSFYVSDHSLNLLGHAWNLWKEGKSMELVDSKIRQSCSTSEISRYVQLGLLCVQERAADRPTMSQVVSMLGNETAAMPYPKEPSFLTHMGGTEGDSSSSRKRAQSVNHVTVSEIYAR